MQSSAGYSSKHRGRVLTLAAIVFFDMMMIACAWIGAGVIAHDLMLPPSPTMKSILMTLPTVILGQLVILALFNIYRSLMRYASINDLMQITKAVFTCVVLASAVDLYVDQYFHLPRAQFLVYGMLSLLFLAATRAAVRLTFLRRLPTEDAKRVIIIGAGSAGERIARELLANKDAYTLVAFVDDAEVKQGCMIHGVHVEGGTELLPKLVQALRVDLLLIAIPSAGASRMRELVSACEKAKCTYRTLPSINEITTGKLQLSTIRNVLLDDLLSRDPIKFDWSKSEEKFKGKRILITGAGGSIGSELSRQLARLEPALLVLVEHSEYNLYQIEFELKKTYPDLPLSANLVNITHADQLNTVFAASQPEIVFHAAAYKHVPLLEHQVGVAITNNMLGMEVLLNQAREFNVQQLVLVSSDKAVNPTNVMGATKRCAEMMCQLAASNHPTLNISTVRFGNVLDSSGSVIPLFRRQIADGGPITVSHPEIERYFMTIPEAVQLIVLAATHNGKNDAFVLDMGTPVKILMLAEQLVRLSGLVPYDDIEIIFTGLRPGEKLYEELFYQHEERLTSDFEKIYRVNLELASPKSLAQKLRELIQNAAVKDPNEEELKAQLFDIVSESIAQLRVG